MQKMAATAVAESAQQELEASRQEVLQLEHTVAGWQKDFQALQEDLHARQVALQKEERKVAALNDALAGAGGGSSHADWQLRSQLQEATADLERYVPGGCT
jgi:hypothetical protein